MKRGLRVWKDRREVLEQSDHRLLASHPLSRLSTTWQCQIARRVCPLAAGTTEPEGGSENSAQTSYRLARSARGAGVERCSAPHPGAARRSRSHVLQWEDAEPGSRGVQVSASLVRPLPSASPHLHSQHQVCATPVGALPAGQGLSLTRLPPPPAPQRPVTSPGCHLCF